MFLNVKELVLCLPYTVYKILVLWIFITKLCKELEGIIVLQDSLS